VRSKEEGLLIPSERERTRDLLDHDGRRPGESLAAARDESLVTSELSPFSCRSLLLTAHC
jgi:hypothetical protein